MIVVTASYSIRTRNRNVVEDVVRAAKREIHGSGYNVAKGLRDLDFIFYQRPAAERAIGRLREVRGVRVRSNLSPA